MAYKATIKGKYIYISPVPKENPEQWAQNLSVYFGVNCEVKKPETRLGFEFILHYPYYKQGKKIERVVKIYLERLPKNYEKWLKEKKDEIAKLLSI